MPTLLQRLKERKLFQWALAYLAGAWLVFQGIEVLAEPWNLSEEVQRTIHVLLGVGFFVTVVLAWYHGEKGRQRASGVELLILAGILIIAGAAVATLGRGPQGEVAGELPDLAISGVSVAVLPFVNIGGDPENEYFSDGITVDIINHLSKIADLKVISRTSAFQYKGANRSLREIAEELGVASIVEGEVQRSGGQVRINAQLIDADSDLHMWADTYDRELTAENIFEIQSEIAQQIAEALQATITPPASGRMERRPTENLGAYDYYLLGRHYLAQWSLEAVEEAIDYFGRAVEADSTYAQGYAGLAYAHAVQGGFSGVHPEVAWPQARAAAEKALTLDERLAEAHTALALEAMSHRYDWHAAREGFERALRLNPSSVDALVWYGLLEGGIWGRFDEAMALLERAGRLDPRSRDVRYNHASLLLWAGRRDEAEEAFENLAALDPDFYGPHDGLAIVYTGQGKYEEAVAVLQAALSLEPDFDVGVGFLGYLYGRLARRADALKQLKRLDELATSGRYVSPVSRAHVYAGLDQVDEAFAWLEKGYEERTHWLIWLGNEPYKWPNLVSDPRFEELLNRMDYPRFQALLENYKE